MSTITNTESGITIPGTSSHFLDPTGPGNRGEGRLRYITGGTGAPLAAISAASAFRRSSRRATSTSA